MKTIHKILLAALFLLPSMSLHAQTDSDREFKQTQADHEKAIKNASEPITQRYRQDLQAAVEPINLRYQAALEKLLDHAAREADLDTATKIKAALNTLPQVVAKQLAGIWALRANTGYAATVTFQSTGTGTHSQYGNFRWRIDGTTLYLGPTDSADKFQLPIADGKLTGVNSIGNELTLTRK